MVADYFTKPLQGKPFNFMREIIMGYKNIVELSKYEPSPIKKRVENTNRNVIGEISDLRKLGKNIFEKTQEKSALTYAKVVSGK